VTRDPLKDEESLAGQIKFVGYVFAALIFVLVVHTLYVSQAAPTPGRHNSPAHLEAGSAPGGDFYTLAERPTQGQVVYVPAYSHIYQGAGDPYPLTITLSVRNTSMDQEIVVGLIRYFDTKGVEIRSYLDNPVRLPALGTTEIVVHRGDESGGSGANFLVEWHADTPVTEPIIEAVMVATTSQRAVAFARRGVVISVAEPSPPEGKGSPPPAGEDANEAPDPTPDPDGH